MPKTPVAPPKRKSTHHAGFAASSFAGFRGDWRGFLAELEAEQNRAWFEGARARYEAELRGPMAALVGSLALALAAHGVPLTGDPKRSLFRIHRDVRFSRDKRPYKTHVSAVLTRDGDKKTPGLLYVHAGLSESFMAVGFYGMEAGQLAAFRDAILRHKSRWRQVETGLAGSDLALSREESVTRLPRGIDAVAAQGLEDVLRLRHFVVRRPLLNAELSDPTLIDLLVEFAGQGLPLLRFGWAALSAAPRPS